MKIEYITRFVYYHYNTGMADNGTFVGERSFSTEEEARACGERIQRLIEDRKAQKQATLADGEFEDACFGGDGYFKEYRGCWRRETQETRIS